MGGGRQVSNPCRYRRFVGRFTDHHAFTLRSLLTHIEFLEQQIGEFDRSTDDQQRSQPSTKSDQAQVDWQEKGERQMVTLARRGFLQGATSLVAVAGISAASGVLIPRPVLAQAVSVQGSRKYGVKALLFDMFGTVLDMWTTLPREAERILKPRGFNLDWQAFGRAWLGEYGKSIIPVRDGKIPFKPLDVLFRENLARVLPQFGVKDLPPDVFENLHLSWHRLDGWPDATSGMAALGKNFLLAPCSNGNIAMMADIARHNNIRFDAILGAELAQNYKPAPKVYQMSCAAFGLKTSECMMVGAAGHTTDFEGAANVGMKTGAVARPNEGGRGKGTTVPTFKVDVVAQDLNDLAEKLMA